MKIKEVDRSASGLPVKLSAPARRALAAAGVGRLDQLTAFSEAEIRRWHGIGPNAIRQILDALEARGLSFASRK